MITRILSITVVLLSAAACTSRTPEQQLCDQIQTTVVQRIYLRQIANPSEAMVRRRAHELADRDPYVASRLYDAGSPMGALNPGLTLLRQGTRDNGNPDTILSAVAQLRRACAEIEEMR